MEQNNYKQKQQEKFRKAEKIGRQLFVDYLKEKGVNDVVQCGQFDAFDLSVNYDDVIKGVEIKYRWDYPSTAPFLKKEGVLFEEKKFNEIFKFETTTTHLPHNYYYISLFNDGVGFSHKIDITHKEKYKWETKVLKKSTVAEEWGDEEKVITYIPIEDCKKFYFNITEDAYIK